MKERDNFYWLNENSRKFLSRGYLKEGQTAEERIREISDNAERLTGIEGFSDKFYDYMSRGFFSLSSPVWSNYGNKRGMPISCFGSYISDNMQSILYTHAEVGMLSKLGGGTSASVNLRGRGSPIGEIGKSDGSVTFTTLFEHLTKIVNQGSVRRGFFTPYYDIEHDDFDEFMSFWEKDSPIQSLTYGLTVSDDFLKRAKVAGSEENRRWKLVLKKRYETGIPYIFFKDTVNRDTVDVYKDKDMTIHASNMCSEIALPASDTETFVCCLSSLNLENWDEMKDTDAVETMTIFLDSVMEEFIQKLEAYRDSESPEDNMAFTILQRVYNFSKRHRALGMGVLGWHSYLQKNMIPFESREAAKRNVEIFKELHKRSYQASKDMAEWWGEPELLNGYGRRNTTTMAIAPTKSSSFILGQVSMGIEPLTGNLFVQNLAKTETIQKNPYLEELLEEKDKNDVSTWLSIQKKAGSVQHLDFLSEDEKDVFKTWIEIDQDAVINQAATRQPYIDQGQSLNLMVSKDITAAELNKLYMKAHSYGVKTLYYQNTESTAQEFMRQKREEKEKSECSVCEG